MNPKELKKRWDNKNIIDLLKKIGPGNNDSVLGSKINGRYDLRGISLPKPSSVEKVHSYEMVKGVLLFKKIKFHSIDFSHATLDYTWFEHCEFKNCIFEETNMKNIRVEACDFDNVIFSKTKFQKSSLNINDGKKTGSFINTEFNNCNLSDCSFSLPLIKDCEFNNCIIKYTNFDGSRFVNTKFVGRMESGWFNGICEYCSTFSLNPFNRFNPNDYPNTMENVDFSQAEIEDLTFANKIKLDTCIFPNDPKYLFIPNLKKVFTRLINEINEYWDDKENALKQINGVLYNKKLRDQNEGFFNTQMEGFKEDPLYQKIYKRLRELALS